MLKKKTIDSSKGEKKNPTFFCNFSYSQDAYARVKNRHVGREIREFSFSEKYIFGRFDSFCTRLRNLLSMFKKINLYTRLFNERMEALLPEEALEDDFKVCT